MSQTFITRKRPVINNIQRTYTKRLERHSYNVQATYLILERFPKSIASAVKRSVWFRSNLSRLVLDVFKSITPIVYGKKRIIKSKMRKYKLPILKCENRKSRDI